MILVIAFDRSQVINYAGEERESKSLLKESLPLCAICNVGVPFPGINWINKKRNKKNILI